MQWIVAVLVLGSMAFARIRVTIETPPPPTLIISADVRIALVPGIVVVERVPEPLGMRVVYRSDRVAGLYGYHHRDLVARGWTRVRHQASEGRYKSEYRRGRAKASLEVRDRRGRVEVRVKEG
jgi:PAS domain-containing protein